MRRGKQGELQMEMLFQEEEEGPGREWEWAGRTELCMALSTGLVQWEGGTEVTAGGHSTPLV